jgi:hypothetical protein
MQLNLSSIEHVWVEYHLAESINNIWPPSPAVLLHSKAALTPNSNGTQSAHKGKGCGGGLNNLLISMGILYINWQWVGQPYVDHRTKNPNKKILKYDQIRFVVSYIISLPSIEIRETSYFSYPTYCTYVANALCPHLRMRSYNSESLRVKPRL